MAMKNGDAVELSARGKKIKHNLSHYGADAKGIALDVSFNAVRVRWIRRVKWCPFGRVSYTGSPWESWHRRYDIRIARQT